MRLQRACLSILDNWQVTSSDSTDAVVGVVSPAETVAVVVESNETAENTAARMSHVDPIPNDDLALS
jgi:arginine repressor